MSPKHNAYMLLVSHRTLYLNYAFEEDFETELIRVPLGSRKGDYGDFKRIVKNNNSFELFRTSASI
jgi:hypothetical protein